MPIRLRRTWYFIPCLIAAAGLASAQAQTAPPNPFASPQAKMHYAPDRDYDLLHVALDLAVDHEKRALRAVVVNTLAPLRDGLAMVRFHCGPNLNIEACEIAGKKAACSREEGILQITAPAPLAGGKAVPVTVRYSSDKEGRGFHWIKPTPSEPQRVGFWTGGQPDNNRGWIPTWDYPNDFATTETRTTVPAGWYVIGNGALKSNKLNSGNKTRTFVWRMEQPHATYLLSLAAGPLEIKTADWRGLPLIYAVPKGKAGQIEETFGETPEMLAFYEEILGVKYPWPKYAQLAMYDFGGGLENISATIFGDGLLADPRRGTRSASAVVAHELAHQWFGDLVTYRDWGELWLGEGFAIFFGQMLYAEHWRGKNDYDHEVEGRMQGYLGESRRYKRPLSNRLYSSPGSSFDSHSYNKGGVILHTMRRQLGDKVFFQGIRHYLIQHRNQPVDSHDFCKAMTEGTGINLQPFCDQWIFKPGHPVLDYAWKWDEAQKQTVLTVKQTQDTKDSTPIYDLNATVGLISGGQIRREKARINQAEQEIRIAGDGKPDAVLLDPDHDFLREVPKQPWAPEELIPILKYAPNAVDRQAAMNRLLDGTPSEAAFQAIAEALRADNKNFSAFRSLERLGGLKRADLRPLLREQLAHPAFGRRAQAIRALARLPKDEADVQTLRGLVNDREPYAVVRAAVQTLRDWDARGNRDIFRKATQVVPERESTRLIAYDALAKADAEEGKQADPEPQTTETVKNVLSDVANQVKDSPRMTTGFRERAIPRGSTDAAGWLKNLKSFTFLAREDVAAKGIERRGARVSRIWHCKMVTGERTLYFSFYLTEDGKAADVDITGE